MVNLLDISKRALRPLQAVDRLESTNREAIIARVRHLSPGLSADDTNISDFLGGYKENPDQIWTDIEPYKTGFASSDYADILPNDIETGQTGVACIDQFISELLQTGYIHNHVRLYLAGYVCHWRRVKWQAGARWFLTHLLDGDPASNNLSWQWVASTFSHKPYYFNLENVERFSGEDVDTRFQANQVLAGSYEDLYATLFPNLEPQT